MPIDLKGRPLQLQAMLGDAREIDGCRSEVVLDPTQECTSHFRRDQLANVEITQFVVASGNVDEKNGGPIGPAPPLLAVYLHLRT